MNNDIRQYVRLELSKRNMSQSRLAAEIGVSRQYLSNIMRGVSGNVPSVWEKIFTELELDLVVQPKQNAPLAEAFIKRDSST
jgi:transcriptional regulator with XRE-family HTH domain